MKQRVNETNADPQVQEDDATKLPTVTYPMLTHWAAVHARASRARKTMKTKKSIVDEQLWVEEGCEYIARIINNIIIIIITSSC